MPALPPPVSPHDVTRWFSDAAAFDRATERLWTPVSRGTLALCPPAWGERVLDACCGAGASALLAAHAVGPTGRVDAVDLAEELLSLGRSRAEDAGLRWLSFIRADVTSFGVPTSYDVVLCVLGAFFLPDMDAGLTHLVSRTRPGGRVAVTTWAQGALSTLLPVLTQAAATEHPLPPGPGRHTASARVQTADGLRAVLGAAGLDDVVVHRVPCVATLDEQLAVDLLDGSAARMLVDGLDDAARGRVRERVRVLMAEQGATSVDATTLVGVARRPAA